jgi:CRP-like cAMP-binding protein
VDSADETVRDAAGWALRALKMDASTEAYSEKTLDLVEKIARIRKISIFENLRVRELFAVAAICRTRACAKGEAAVLEGDPGDALYLIVEGELSVIKGLGTEREVVLDIVRNDDFFGEMALIDNQGRSASVRAESDALLLAVESSEFAGVMEEYPSIPINICKVFCRRIRNLLDNLQ